MHKEFQLRIHGLADGADLFQGEFPLQHQPAEAQALQSASLLRSADGTLGGGVHDEGIAHGKHRRILHNQGVHPGFLQRMDQFLRLRNLLFLQKGVHRGIDAGAEAMGIRAEPLNVFHRISGGLPGSKGRSCDINGIGPAVYGCKADVYVPGWSQQFQRLQIRGL